MCVIGCGSLPLLTEVVGLVAKSPVQIVTHKANYVRFTCSISVWFADQLPEMNGIPQTWLVLVCGCRGR